MAQARQITVETPDKGQTGAKGKADRPRATVMYASSPLFNEYTAEEVAKLGQKLLLTDPVNDGGHTFGEISLNYNESPRIDTMDPGEQNLPNMYQPNPNSPGEGNGLNSADIPAPPEGYNSHTDQFGEGIGSKLAPAVSSKGHGRHEIGNYQLGKGPTPS